MRVGCRGWFGEVLEVCPEALEELRQVVAQVDVGHEECGCVGLHGGGVAVEAAAVGLPGAVQDGVVRGLQPAAVGGAWAERFGSQTACRGRLLCWLVETGKSGPGSQCEGGAAPEQKCERGRDDGGHDPGPGFGRRCGHAATGERLRDRRHTAWTTESGDPQTATKKM